MNSPFDDADFRKASGSGTGDCVEVAITAHTPDTVGLRDSKNPREALVLLAPVEWLAFMCGTVRNHPGAL
ncbi:DUF397 domain-containing protein [Nocardiopsis sp. HUAS JQ3]|uniref:DUF397 domain-containing protein n=1 Tax=Nocardiopsis sp. HUAS JQ3 TaxID=3061629 RepID=UPI0023A91C39|nr:DUF397 domain-containing protein [Nocardiopsis sp. HUAS JQ3]WDZ88914.1 DUF397 domain-containing protein [Nocardiopsis sp. HUAS JQ3]